MTDQLRDFTDNAAQAMGHGTEYDADPDETDEIEPTDAEPGTDEAGDASAEYDQLSERFYESLTPEDLAAAERSPTVRDGLWQAWLAEQGIEVDQDAEGDDADADDGAEDEGDEGDEDAPSTALDVVRLAYANAADLVDQDGRQVTPGEWLAGWVDADPAAWARALRSVGWPASTEQPSHATLRLAGRGVQGEVLEASWSEHVAKARDAGRYFGQ